jgi:hypothetical protein
MGYPKVYRNEGGTGTITFMAPGLASRAVYINPFRVGDLWWEESEMSTCWKLLFEAEESKPEPDPAHHAPSPTADTIKVDHPDQYFKPPQAKHDEPLTKRERFAMEFMSQIIRKWPAQPGRHGDMIPENHALGALAYADALIAELAKERA